MQGVDDRWFLLAFLAVVGLVYVFRHRLFPGSTMKGKVQAFLGRDPKGLSILSRNFTRFDLPNIELAIRAYVEETGAKHEMVGYTVSFNPFGKSLSEMVTGDGFIDRTKIAPVRYKQIQIGPAENLNCLENGLHFIRAEDRIVCHVRFDVMEGATQVEVLAQDADAVQRFFDRLGEILAARNVYRGKVLTIESQVLDKMRGECAAIRFHRPPEVSREDIILPPDRLALIERNTVGFFKNVGVLRETGRSAKRGILLYGKPGTGKTFTAKWLASGIPGLTTIILSAEQLHLIKDCCTLARMLAPSLVIMEDIDLVATHRDERTKEMSAQITLHQILNELDGMADNTEVLFLMTTNRPEAIEPALAGRPGRVDQAIEYPLPDADCRKRLIDKYSRGLNVQIQAMDPLIARLDGASPAFIQELMRKSLLIAGERGMPPEITEADIDTALRELLFGGGDLTRQLLGFKAISDT